MLIDCHIFIRDKFIKTNRPEIIKVKYLNSQNQEVIEEFRGISAVCVQHECDHLKGELFIKFEKLLNLKKFQFFHSEFHLKQ
mgnify:CR=1 FL=1